MANTAIVPVQDPLMLDGAARLNRPGVPDGNWTWRLTPDQPVAERLEGLGVLTERYNRLPAAESSDQALSHTPQLAAPPGHPARR